MATGELILVLTTAANIFHLVGLGPVRKFKGIAFGQTETLTSDFDFACSVEGRGWEHRVLFLFIIGFELLGTELVHASVEILEFLVLVLIFIFVVFFSLVVMFGSRICEMLPLLFDLHSHSLN